MYRYIILLIGFLIAQNLRSQIKYEIKDFAPGKYKATVWIDPESKDDVFKKGSVQIFDLQKNKPVIEVKSNELTFDLDENNQIETNIKELPYGTQSLLIYEDVNFDGQPDLAIMDGQHSCYHGPSYKIYLQTSKGLKYSQAFTDLAQNYCGMFQTDHETQQLYTMTKSGCCWHQFTTFKVVDTVPKPVSIEEEDVTHFPYFISHLTQWKNGQKYVKTIKIFSNEKEDIKPLLSFELQKNHKKVLVFETDGTLNYALLKKDGTIEFSFPFDAYSEPNKFNLTKNKQQLFFKNKGVKYEIFERKTAGKLKKIDINVYLNGKKYTFKGNIHSLKGDLQSLKPHTFQNLFYVKESVN